MIPDRPSVRRSSSLEDYKAWVREYVEARAEDGTCHSHHEEEYDLVVDCPLCGGPAMIALQSLSDSPRWKCMTSYAPGHSIREEDGELIASNYNELGRDTASAPAPWKNEKVAQ